MRAGVALAELQDPTLLASEREVGWAAAPDQGGRALSLYGSRH